MAETMVEKLSSSQLAMDQMQRRSESLASILTQSSTSLLPSSTLDEDFLKAKKGCDVNMNPSRPIAIAAIKPETLKSVTTKTTKELQEEELSDPWSKMKSAQLKTSKMKRSTTHFG